jgi:signal transduction histidine kinase/CheY-like chemotaxis protein
VTLNYKENFFAVEFAALSFMAPARNRYRYKLEGLEQQWNEVDGQRRVATYTSLAPATYVFRVQGSNNDLLWSEAGARLEIIVLPPWWGTWWFRSLAFLGLATVALAVYRSRVRSLRLTAAQLELQVAHRTRELQIARDSADAANQVKSAFLANMSHELRTPLNAILGFSNLLRNGEVSEKQRKDLDIINRSGEHLLSLINGVLDLAKVEAGRTELQVAPCDVWRLVREIVEMMRARANEKNLEIRLIESAALPRLIQADAVKLRQVLLNLVGNAVKFTENGYVEVRLTSRTADVGKQILLTFEVQDTGIGIAPDDQQRIFDAFVQASAKGCQKGTGLGLTISRQFVELMGGAIHVESMPGKGSRFRVDLPVEPAESVELMPSEAEQGRIVGLVLSRPGLRVLIVEDGEENRLVLHRLMEQAGFLVRLAEDGAQGVETFQSWRPHFIWMDLRMPVMDGKEAIRRIRALDGGLDVKIAALTASAFISEREEVLAVGVDDFIRKPYQQSEIFDCMARHLGLRPIYEKVSHQERTVPLSKEDLYVLPQDLIRELAAVVVTVDSRRIREVIARISDCDRTVGSKLTHLADRYAYTAILELVDADEQSQEV